MNDLKNLVNFWNDCFNNDDKIEVTNYKSLALSKKLYDALEILSKEGKVLDYGCGHGWASIILAKEGCKNVTASDMAPNAIKMAKEYSKVYQVDSNINFKLINDDYLNNELDSYYDGVFCSNVLDVVPMEVSQSIIKFLHRVVKENGLVIIGLNYYLDLNKAPNGFKVIDKNVYINDILRLVSLTDEEWVNIFSKYFTIEKTIHFSWPNENVERRRIFYLRKR